MEAGAEQGSPGSWRYWRDDELGPEFGAAMDEIFTIYSQTADATSAPGPSERWPRGDEPQSAWERSIKAKALDLLRGLLPASTLSPRRHLRLRAGLRAAAAAARLLAAARGPRGRRDGARGARRGDPQLHLPGRPSRARRRVDLLPRAAPRRHRALGRPARPRPPRGPRRARGRADPRRRRRGPAAGGVAVRGDRAPGGRDREPDRAPRPDRARGASSPTSSASAATAATGPAAAGRRSATGSRSSPTTAGSATCSATGC